MERRANILKLVAKGLITDQERDTALRETMDERNKLIRERTLIEEEMGTVGMDESAVRDAAEVLASVRDEWLSEEKSPEEWRWLIHQLIRSVTVFPETSYPDQFNGSGGKLRDVHIDCVFLVSEENLQLFEEQGDKVLGRQSPEDV